MRLAKSARRSKELSGGGASFDVCCPLPLLAKRMVGRGQGWGRGALYPRARRCLPQPGASPSLRFDDAPPSPPLRGGRWKKTRLLASLQFRSASRHRRGPGRLPGSAGPPARDGAAPYPVAPPWRGSAWPGLFSNAWPDRARAFSPWPEYGLTQRRAEVTPQATWAGPDNAHQRLKPLGYRPLGCRAQKPFTLWRTCSTSGGDAKQWPTSLRHSWKSAEPRKSTVWFSVVCHLTNSR